MAAVTSLPRVRFFIFHYESGLVLKIVSEKNNLVRLIFPFFSFFIFEHFPQMKWKKNTRTSMVAAVTSLPRVRFYLLFVWKMSNFKFCPDCVCTRALHMCFHSYMFSLSLSLSYIQKTAGPKAFLMSRLPLLEYS